MAAAYAAGIVRDHPFIDGNKRTGFVVGVLFLELNGYRFVASEEDAAEAIARRLDDPVILTQVLQRRIHDEVNREQLDVARAHADEALHWARAAGDDWDHQIRRNIKSCSYFMPLISAASRHRS